MLDVDMTDADDTITLGVDGDGDWDDVPLPAGEEAAYTSHAGGENVLHQVMEGTLILRGYLGSSPDKPALAISLRTLEIYRQIHRVCPRFTIDSLAKTLNHLHKVPRKAHLAEQLTNTYDAYLEIQRWVDRRVKESLGRDKAWDAKGICPPCFYRVQNEPPLKYSFLGALDGGNSLKLVDSTFRAGNPRFDNRKSTSFRWLTPSEVDKYKDEVKNAPKLSSEETDELTKCLNTCVERWKAAGPEARKKMFALFAVAGIFISVCRHGHVLLICDMIRSGELMKYPLAIVAKLFELYGSDIALGYDIMCAFYKTLLRSSLGHDTVALRLRGVVPAFHGHAHNRGCQLGWHPMYIEGVGLEDFEECERTFSLSNHLASCTRLATPFHRQQQIDEHFDFHDKDKYAASGNFIFQNYRQAVEKITLNTLKLETLEEQLHTTAAARTKLPIYNLCNRSLPIEASRTAERDFKSLDHLIIAKGYTAPQIKLVRSRYSTTHTRLVLINEELTRFEELNGIEECWTSTHPQYHDAVLMMGQRRYRRALDELERLVVQRLMELTKLSMSGVAYKLRDKIGKALKTRADAIHRAVNTYNVAAAALNPPREQLSFVQVLKTVSLAEFDLLRDTCNDIRKLPWTQPARREAAGLYFGILRAKEEIQRLNVEITRLLTFMLDEHVDYYIAIQQNILQNPNLAHELSDRWAHQARINESIAERLVKTSRLPAFSGRLFPGEQVAVDVEEDDIEQQTSRELEGVDGDMLVHFMENLDIDIASEM
ncbi:hypothetical protein C8R45DRAFT_1054313 [Mycena sanguinolenta]|nr:hypothetical protein C8R45DRAFT_1054313 [Mycena sanguinolenta]